MIHKPTNRQVQPDQHYLYIFARLKFWRAVDAEGQTFGGTIDVSCLAWRKVKLLEVKQLIELKEGLEAGRSSY